MKKPSDKAKKTPTKKDFKPISAEAIKEAARKEMLAKAAAVDKPEVLTINTMRDLRNAWNWDSPAAFEFFKACGATHTTLSDAAALLGYKQQFLIDEINQRPDLKTAYEESKIATKRNITKALINGALKGDVKAQIFFLRNRDPENFRDAQIIDGSLKTYAIAVTEDVNKL